MSDVSFQSGQGQPQVQPLSAATPAAKSEVTAEESAAAMAQAAAAALEEKKKKLRAELAKLEEGEGDRELTLEERVGRLESVVSSLAGHTLPTKVAA